MNYAEIKQNLISLGFGEEADYTELEGRGYTYDAINRAITQIGTQFPYIETYEFEVDDTDEGYLYIDMTDIADDFRGFAETPVLFEKDGKEFFTKFADYKVEMERTLVINCDDNKGSFRVYYEAQPTKITETTVDGFTPELPLKCHHLIPLLAVYYLWLDDDAAKATQYFNMYETELANVQGKDNVIRMKVVTDWRGI